MANRNDFNTALRTLLGSANVYFQPPETIKMAYPAIVYSLSRIQNDYADNMVYRQKTAYNVILITRNPDDTAIKALSKFPYSSFNNAYVSDNLNHYSFTIYY